MPRITLSVPLELGAVLGVAFEIEETGWSADEHEPKEKLAARAEKLLVSKAALLDEYFRIKIDGEAPNATLQTVPMLLTDHFPEVTSLPILLLRLATEVDWENEQQCFIDIATELANAYSDLPEKEHSRYDEPMSQDSDQLGNSTKDDAEGSVENLPHVTSLSTSSSSIMSTIASVRENTTDSVKSTSTPWASDGAALPAGPGILPGWNDEKYNAPGIDYSEVCPQAAEILQYLWFPAFRMYLIPPRDFASDSTIMEIACLERLYKVFERC